MLFGSMTAKRGLMGAPRKAGPATMGGGDLPPNVYTGLDGQQIALPGVVSGYGGGTWNADGSVATPVARLGDAPMFQPTGGGASAFGWDEGGTDTLPALPPPGPSLPTLGSQGIFGTSSPTLGSAAPPTGAAAMGKLTNDNGFPAVSAMGERLGSNGFPGRPVGQPFDYDGALASMLPQHKKRSTLEKIASIVAPMLMGLGGNQAGANAFLANQQSRRDTDGRQRSTALSMIERWKHDDFARQNGADLRASAPRVIGRSMVQYDPNSGGVNEVYDGAEDFETYAETQGLEPGTQEYLDAVQDYVLKGDGPAAYGRDRGLDDYRTGNRLKLEGTRQGNRESLEGIRQNNRVTTRGLPTYRDTHPRAASGSTGEAVPTSTGPNGEKAFFRGGKWVDAQGRPIQ